MERRSFVAGASALLSGATAIGGLDATIPQEQPIPMPISFVLGAGQSNEVGKGTASKSPPP